MKAVIMAGGKGTRLRPLTEHTPKPLLPLAGVPCIRRILRHLYAHGIREAAITTGYLAEKLEKALGEEAEGIALTYFREETPLGTAGGVAMTRDFIGEEELLVISGDALTECDLTTARQRRQETEALGLILLTRVVDPGEFGVVLTDGEGRITGFSEKPSLTGTYSNTVNTGIYLFSPTIFSHIPPGVCDFGRDLFPALLRAGERLYGLVDSGYWCDIGDCESYRKANLRLTAGENAVGPHSTFPETGVRASVIGTLCRIGRQVNIEEAVLDDHVVVEDGAVIGAGSVIGRGCRIGRGAVLGEGTVLACRTVVPAGAQLRSVGRREAPRRLASYAEGDGFRCPEAAMTVSLAVSLGGAAAEVFDRGRIGVMTDGSEATRRIAASLIRGIRAGGGRAVDLGEGFEAMASYAASALALSLTFFCRVSEGEAALSLYDRDGLYPVRDRERKLFACLGKESEPFGGTPPEQEVREVAESLYQPMLTHHRPVLEGFPVTVVGENRASQLLTRALLAMGGRVGSGGLKLTVSDDGFRLTAEQEGFAVDDWHIKALLLRYLIRDRVVLSVTVPDALRDLCRGRCRLYTHAPTGDEEEIRRSAARHPELRHACAAAMELAGLLAVSGKSLRTLCGILPRFSCRGAEMISESPDRLSILPDVGAPAGDGVVATYAHGTVRVIPSRRGFRLTAEAASGEYAEEILALSEQEIRRLLS